MALILGGCVQHHYIPVLITPADDAAEPVRRVERRRLLNHTEISTIFYGVGPRLGEPDQLEVRLGLEVLNQFADELELEFSEFELRDRAGGRFPLVRAVLGPQKIKRITLQTEEWARLLLVFRLPADYDFETNHMLMLYWELKHHQRRTPLLTWYLHEDSPSADRLRHDPYLELPPPYSGWMFPGVSHIRGWRQFSLGDAYRELH